jgi:hypothetical protein
MNIKKTIQVAFLFLTVLLTACSSNNEDTNLPSSEIESIAKSGTWRVTKFIDSNTDETNHFSGFNFTFQDNGVLTSSNGSINYQGTWSISSSSNDDSNDDADFNIFFNLTNDFEDLNDDWDIISISENKIELIDISGGNGDTDYLTFEKN